MGIALKHEDLKFGTEQNLFISTLKKLFSLVGNENTWNLLQCHMFYVYIGKHFLFVGKQKILNLVQRNMLFAYYIFYSMLGNEKFCQINYQFPSIQQLLV